MYISQLFEAEEPSSVLVIYPGRFQPWHKGHRAVYEHLVRLYGRDNVFIATSNKVDPPRSPFSFAEKLQFMQLTGIPMDRVVETKDPYRALELVQHYNPKTTRLIFAVSEKDMAEDPRFKFGYKKDGSPTYLQAMPKNPTEMQPFEQHGYVMTVPTFQFTVLGEPMRSATEVRAQFAQADDATQREIIKDLFGRYSPEIHSLMKHKIALNENYEYMPPGAGASQTRRVMNKISTKDNKFIWKKPNQIGGSFTDKQLLDLGFKKSQYNSWGGTQAMWNRLLGIKEQLNRPTPTAQEIIQKFKISPEELIAQLKLGVKVELEHTKDARTAYEIALDHLNERPDYYTRLMNAGLEETATSNLKEFTPAGGAGGTPPRGPKPPGRDPWGSEPPGDDPYNQPVPSHYSRSIDYFGQFEADHFDKEDFNQATGEFRGYWYYDGELKQIGYFKFDNPKKTGSNDPGMGWYYEPLDEGIVEDAAGVGVIAQNKKMAKDPRYSMSMTKDVRPGQDKKNLKAWRLIK